MTLVEELNQVRLSIGSCVVYQNEVIMVRSIIASYIRMIMKSPLVEGAKISYELNQELDKLKETTKKLGQLIRMLSGDMWLTVALEWSVQKPVHDMKKLMTRLTSRMGNIGLEVLKYEPRENDITTDLLAIYKIFQNAKGNTAKVNERLNSVSRYLISLSVELPVSPEVAELANIFSDVPECHIERTDFKIEAQIGKGSSGVVYEAVQISTGLKVAVKQLDSVNLNKYELASFKREVTALSTLQHKYLIKFIGATLASPYWIITQFMPGKSLFARLREPFGLTPIQLTRIAYQVAEGMAYLHSKNMIHRDLKTLNILLDEDLSPRICDFGITREIGEKMTGLVGTLNYMAPEVIGRNQYNLKADVFSFGMMLWEMLNQDIPFSSLDQINTGRAILNGQRPPISKMAPKSLQTLIKDCWQADKDARPSFDDIIERMRSEEVHFPGADEAEVMQFYETNSEPEMKESPSQLLLPSIAMQDQNILSINQCLLDGENINENLEQLTTMLNCNERVRFFLGTEVDGSRTIYKLSPAGGAQFNSLVRQVRGFLTSDQVAMIFPKMVKSKNYSAAEIVMEEYEDKCRELLEPFVPQLIEDREKVLLKRYFEGNNHFEFLDVQTAASLQSLDIIERMAKSKNIAECVTDANLLYIENKLREEGDSLEKTCALRIALEFSDNKFLEYGQKQRLIKSVLGVSNLELVGKFLYRVSMNQDGAQNVLGNTAFLQASITSPFIMMCFIGIGKFFPEKIMGFAWVMDTLDQFIKDRKNIELALRILGVLSLSPSFTEQTSVLTSLSTLIKECECNEIELRLLLAIIYNCPSTEFIACYKQLLLMGEKYPMVLVILSNWTVPDPSSRSAKRLVRLIQHHISGSDPYGLTGACKLLLRMGTVPKYVELAKAHDFERLLNEAGQKERNVQIFILIMNSLKRLSMAIYEPTTDAIRRMMEGHRDIEEAYEKLKTFVSE